MTIPKKSRAVRMFRLQWEPAQQAHVLLYPEGMVKLNRNAVEILRCCDGSRDLFTLVSELEQALGSTRLQQDAEDFLQAAADQGWIQ